MGTITPILTDEETEGQRGYTASWMPRFKPKSMLIFRDLSEGAPKKWLKAYRDAPQSCRTSRKLAGRDLNRMKSLRVITNDGKIPSF